MDDISEKMFKDDLVWMSYRYCIGRHTIASHGHAMNLVKFIYPKIDDDTRAHYAEDMLMCINDTARVSLNWHSDDGNDQSVFSSIMLHLIENDKVKDIPNINKVCIVNDHILDTRTYTIVTNDTEGEKGKSSFWHIYATIDDLLPWLDVAILFDKSKHVRISGTYNGNEFSYECFPSIIHSDIDGVHTYKYVYRTVDEYVSNPYLTSYLEPEIVSKSKIESLQ